LITKPPQKGKNGGYWGDNTQLVGVIKASPLYSLIFWVVLTQKGVIGNNPQKMEGTKEAIKCSIF